MCGDGWDDDAEAGGLFSFEFCFQRTRVLICNQNRTLDKDNKTGRLVVDRHIVDTTELPGHSLLAGCRMVVEVQWFP